MTAEQRLKHIVAAQAALSKVQKRAALVEFYLLKLELR
jgi:hypothetical protein